MGTSKSNESRDYWRLVLLACAMLLIAPVTAFAGPKEEAFQVVEHFQKAYGACDEEGLVKLFASEPVFLPTVRPILMTRTDQIAKYFQGLSQMTACSVTIDEYSTQSRRTPSFSPV